MKTLPKLSEYLDKLEDYLSYGAIDLLEYQKRASKLKNFYKEQTNISNYVPAIEKDGKWIVLEKPIFTTESAITELEKYNLLNQEYQTALDNVVFKCKVCVFSEEHIRIDFTNEISLHWYKGSLDSYKCRDLKTIEDLSFLNLEVNEPIIKKFNL